MPGVRPSWTIARARRRRDGGDPTVASRWCKKFAAHPEQFNMPKRREENSSDSDWESEIASHWETEITAPVRPKEKETADPYGD